MKRDALDRLFSRYIRERDHWTCQRCGQRHEPASQGLHCAHIFSRGRQVLRHDPTNAIALCYGCHRLADSRKDTVLYPLYIRLFGQDQFDRLRLRAQTASTSAAVKISRDLTERWLRAQVNAMRTQGAR